MSPHVGQYLDFALATPSIQRHRFTRALFSLSQKLSQSVFLKTIERAHRYRIVDLDTLERISWLCLSQEMGDIPVVEVDEDLESRPAYQEGYLTDLPDLSRYDDVSEPSPTEEKESTDEDRPF